MSTFEQSQGNSLSACSACAGDYEDPDETAPRDGDESDEEQSEIDPDASEDFLRSEKAPQK